MSSQDHPHSAPFLTREQLCQQLNERGYPISLGYFNRLCLPSQGLGPPIVKWFLDRPLYDLEAGLAWAEARCTPCKPGHRPSRRPVRPAAAAG
jgi:hypothetical protein